MGARGARRMGVRDWLRPVALAVAPKHARVHLGPRIRIRLYTHLRATFRDERSHKEFY
jgi:hypothetical protein